VAVGAASVREIDRWNIRRASILAMARALHRLGFPPPPCSSSARPVELGTG
jgi:hypothetical protein